MLAGPLAPSFLLSEVEVISWLLSSQGRVNVEAQGLGDIRELELASA